jgi:hypothetical protein
VSPEQLVGALLFGNLASVAGQVKTRAVLT